jgi:hypothetical protein
MPSYNEVYASTIDRALRHQLRSFVLALPGFVTPFFVLIVLVLLGQRVLLRQHELDEMLSEAWGIDVRAVEIRYVQPARRTGAKVRA